MQYTLILQTNTFLKYRFPICVSYYVAICAAHDITQIPVLPPTLMEYDLPARLIARLSMPSPAYCCPYLTSYNSTCLPIPWLTNLRRHLPTAVIAAKIHLTSIISKL